MEELIAAAKAVLAHHDAWAPERARNRAETSGRYDDEGEAIDPEPDDPDPPHIAALRAAVRAVESIG